MGQHQKHGRDLTCRLNDIFFALNIGLASAIILRVKLGHSRLGQNGIAEPALAIIERINGVLHLRPRNQVGLELIFLAGMLAIAMVVLVLVRILRTRRASNSCELRQAK